MESICSLFFPNPTSNTITITTNSGGDPSFNKTSTFSGIMSANSNRISLPAQSISVIPANNGFIKQVQFFNAQEGLVKQLHFATAKRQVDINVADLRPGVYFAEISDGLNTVHKKIIIRQ